MFGNELRCKKCNQYKPDRCTCNTDDQELVERNKIAQLFDDYALEVSDRGHDASNPWIMADKAISLCRQHDMQMAIDAVDQIDRDKDTCHEVIFKADAIEAIKEKFSNE